MLSTVEAQGVSTEREKYQENPRETQKIHNVLILFEMKMKDWQTETRSSQGLQTRQALARQILTPRSPAQSQIQCLWFISPAALAQQSRTRSSHPAQRNPGAQCQVKQTCSALPLSQESPSQLEGPFKTTIFTKKFNEKSLHKRVRKHQECVSQTTRSCFGCLVWLVALKEMMLRRKKKGKSYS